MCTDPLVTLFAIIGVGILTTELIRLGGNGIFAALGWWYGEELED